MPVRNVKRPKTIEVDMRVVVCDQCSAEEDWPEPRGLVYDELAHGWIHVRRSNHFLVFCSWKCVFAYIVDLPAEEAEAQATTAPAV